MTDFDYGLANHAIRITSDRSDCVFLWFWPQITAIRDPFYRIREDRAVRPNWRRRPHRPEPHRRHCATEISPDRDTTGSSARCCWTCASLPTAPSGILPTLAENLAFSRNQGEIRKETDCLLEGDGFELLVPRHESP